MGHQPPVGTELDFAQIVIPDGAVVSFRGVITVVEGVNLVNVPVSGVVPEPSALALTGLALMAFVGYRARRR